jgi:benzoyl-CoA reductase/2-hydroxyglutaryl-CoA dehydratase subunit BcrC/BadD/HgdB
MTISETKKSRVGSLARSANMIKKMSMRDPDFHKSELYHYEMLYTYFKRLEEAEANGNTIGAHTVFFPIELLYAMDIVPLHGETATLVANMFLRNSTEALNAGAELKMAPEICSPHRSFAGCFKMGLFPKPDMMMWSNLICDNSAKCGELIADMNKCPQFFLDHPFSLSHEEEKYLLNELQDLVSFLEEVTGRKMNWEKLSESIVRAEEQVKLLHEIAEIRKNVPSPLYNRAYLETRTPDQLFAGQPEATTYLTILRDELAEMVEQGKGAVEPERFRIMSLFVPPMYLMSFLEKQLVEHGAVSVVEPYFTYWPEVKLDPSKPLESLAIKYSNTPERRTLYGPLGDETIDTLVESAREFKVDGAIYYAFIGCRHSNALIKLIKDQLNELDIPMLTLDIDLLDPTVNNESEIQQKMDQFFELLEDM